MSDARWIKAADQAKLVRAALKKHWPAVKFSVTSKSYSGGASISVSWMDGPASVQVDSLLSQYRGGDFDGSIDMAISHYHWLMPDGTACIARSPGTTGSMGYISPERREKPHPEAELVSFHANYISTSRSYSVEFYTRQLTLLCKRYGVKDIPEVKVNSFGGAHAPDLWKWRYANDSPDLDRLMWEKLTKTQAAH